MYAMDQRADGTIGSQGGRAEEQGAKLLAERERRVNDAIALRKPDRVPVWHGVPGLYPSQVLGISREEQMVDVEKSLEANFRTALYYQSDMVEIMPPIGATLAPLGYRHLRWANHGLPADSGWQYRDEEVMKPEEYDELIYDPSDFIVRKYWARAYQKLAALAALPPLRETQGYFAAPFAFAAFGTPAGVEALEALREAGAAAFKTVMALAEHRRRLEQAGFPLSWGAFGAAPFDLLGDFLRGRKGIMLDMYRCPAKLEAACEKLLPTAIEAAVRAARQLCHPRVFIAVHGGVEGFMSVDQYKRFYWPGLQQLIVALTEHDLTPWVFVEGRSDSRLETMADVPAGKVCYWFDHVDMRRAKEVLGHKACIAGNVPLALLTLGTPDDVRAYCQVLIDEVGRDGGFILGPSGQTDDVKVENVKAMVDFAKGYGEV